MAHDKQNLESGKSIESVREILGEALVNVRDIPSGMVNNQDILTRITLAMSVLFEVGSNPDMLVRSDGAGQAMEHLREALEIIQGADDSDSNVLEATSVIAKTLAALYPVAKLRERQSMTPPSPMVAAPPGSERRLAPRIAIEADIGFQSESTFYMGFTEDISTGGIFVATYDIKGMGDYLDINFTLPNGHLVSCRGEVRWVREYNEQTPDTPPGMGVRFEDLAQDDKDAIDEFLSIRPALFFDE